MAGKSFSINAIIKTTFQGAEKGIGNIQKAISGISDSIKGVGPAISKDFNMMSVDLDKLKDRAAAGVLIGPFQNPAATQEFLADIRSQEAAYAKLTQTVVLANIQDEKSKKSIQDQTKAIKAKEDALQRNERALEATRLKTKEISEEELVVGNKLGIDPKKLRDPIQLQAEIDKRKTPGGKAKDEKAEGELKDLQKLIDLRKRLEDESAGTLATEKLLTDQIAEQNAELKQQKQERRDTMLASVNQLKVGKDITKEDKEKLVALIKQGEQYENIEEAVKSLNYKQQTKEIQDTTNANKKFNETLDKKKKGLFANITAATVYYAALRAVRKIITNITKTVTELDKSFTEIAMVTKMTRQES
jgi:hypothetical protein